MKCPDCGHDTFVVSYKHYGEVEVTVGPDKVKEPDWSTAELGTDGDDCELTQWSSYWCKSCKGQFEFEDLKPEESEEEDN
jgi:hypothetical protein